MIEATKKMFQNYATFKGRTSRSDFWWAMLGYLLLAFVIGFVAGLIAGITQIDISFIPGLYTLATIVPLLAMYVRRLHDINKSGWWVCISFVPFVGSIILLVFLCSASVNENNQY